MTMQIIPTSRDVEEKIKRIETGLVPDIPTWRDERKSSTIAERMAHYGVAGLSLALINNGRVEWTRVYGVRESGKPEPVDTNTLFQAGSISKTATALVALRLVDMGLLSLDEDVNSYLTSWRIPANGSWQPCVTIRQLLSHTAGTTVNGFPGYSQEEELPSLLQILNGQPPANNRPIYVNIIPGTHFRYSGGGTTILQQVLIDLLAKPFPDLMRELLLQPLGMEHSTFAQPLPAEWHNSAATGHYWVKEQPVAGKWHTYPEMAAAGLWTTPTDLAQVGIAIQRSMAGEPGAFLSKERVQEMLTPHTPEGTGLGLINMQELGISTRFGHQGGTHGCLCELTAHTNPHVGVAIMLNSFLGESLIAEIVAAIAREYDWPDAPPQEQTVSVEPALLDTYVGSYEYAPDVSWQITRFEDTLILHPPAQAPIQLYARSGNEFFAKSVKSEVTFPQSKPGSPAQMLLTQEGRQKVMRKL